jgi:succinoglycan biosynthesis protein ExoM
MLELNSDSIELGSDSGRQRSLFVELRSIARSSPTMNGRPDHITVCVCTYRRPRLLQRLLESLTRQDTSGSFTISVVVADNDAAQSAREVVAEFAATAALEVVYCVEPRQNIALVRNKALECARGELIAFIDDDEFPEEDWLARLREVCDQHSVAGVLGPVKPHFEDDPPAWIINGGFCERPEYITGTILEWWQGRTGNVLFRREILQGVEQPFQPKFGTGGEDQDFYRRMMERGCVFIWCNEAVAYETVPPARWKRSYMFKRALLRGRNSLKHSKNRGAMIGKSVVAVPLYLLSLPVTLLGGHHWFMRNSVKLCDHLGRILTLLGINPIWEREM